VSFATVDRRATVSAYGRTRPVASCFRMVKTCWRKLN